MEEAFETNSIKRGGKIPLRQLKKLFETLAISEDVFQQQQQLCYGTHFSQSLHFQENQQHRSGTSHEREREDWTRLYHKTLKGLETMIDIQRMTKDIKKLAEEANTILTEVEGTILMASINN